MHNDITKLLNPDSIAIIGASQTEQKLGYIVLKNVIDSGFKGDIYPINPNYDSILKLTCYKKISDTPKVPELAIISIPAAGVLDCMKEIADRGIKNVVVFSAGFKEIGHEGEALESQLVKIAEEHDIKVLGPNCLGFINNLHDLNATFSKVHKKIGNLRFLSQSGAIASSVFDWAEHSNIGFCDFVTLGNKANVTENDLLNYWLHTQLPDKPEVRLALEDKRLSRVIPIGMYLESIADGGDFINLTSQLSLHHPLFVLKPGKSKHAQQAMQSHTGSIAGEDSVLDAALEQSGVIRCEGLEDFFDMAKAFAWEKAPEGPNVAIVSNAGGPAVMSTDFVEQYGLKLAQISDKTKERLMAHLPRSSNFMNPIDVLGDALATRYGSAIDIVLAQKNVDAMVVILTPQVMTQIYLTAEYIGRLSEIHNKPILCAFMGGTSIEKGEKILNMYKIPNFRYPERAIRVLGNMWAWKKNRDSRLLRLKKLSKVSEPYDTDLANPTVVSEVIEIVKTKNHANASGQIALNNFEANEIMKSWNIPTPPTDTVVSFEGALKFTEDYGWPVVLKVSSNKLVHKTDVGGVVTNISNRYKLEKALGEMKQRINKLDNELKQTVSIQIQKQITGGVEIILGVKQDKTFGHVLMFGAGGTMAEVIQDRNLKLLPLDHLDAELLVANSKVFKLLNGFRGGEKMNLNALYNVITKFANLAENFPEISEMEINPLIVTKDEVFAVDSKGIIAA